MFIICVILPFAFLCVCCHVQSTSWNINHCGNCFVSPELIKKDFVSSSCFRHIYCWHTQYLYDVFDRNETVFENWNQGTRLKWTRSSKTWSRHRRRRLLVKATVESAAQVTQMIRVHRPETHRTNLHTKTWLSSIACWLQTKTTIWTHNKRPWLTALDVRV